MSCVWDDCNVHVRGNSGHICETIYLITKELRPTVIIFLFWTKGRMKSELRIKVRCSCMVVLYSVGDRKTKLASLNILSVSESFNRTPDKTQRFPSVLNLHMCEENFCCLIVITFFVRTVFCFKIITVSLFALYGKQLNRCTVKVELFCSFHLETEKWIFLRWNHTMCFPFLNSKAYLCDGNILHNEILS